jgi:anti-repressor protein
MEDFFMQELIKIKKQDGIETVNARELHEFLESKERFSKWFERMLEYGFDQGLDFTPYQNVHPQNKQEIVDYYVTIDMAKELCMLARNSKGKEARKYFIEVEKKAKSILVPQSLPEALRAYADEVERRELAENRIGRLIHDSKTYTSTEIAKELNLKSATQLNKILEEKQIQFKQNGTWVLYAKYAGCEYTSVKQQELDDGRIIYNRHWTGKGRDFIIDQFKGEE